LRTGAAGAAVADDRRVVAVGGGGLGDAHRPQQREQQRRSRGRCEGGAHSSPGHQSLPPVISVPRPRARYLKRFSLATAVTPGSRTLPGRHSRGRLYRHISVPRFLPPTCPTPTDRPLDRSDPPPPASRPFPCCVWTAPAVETQQPSAALLRSSSD